ncbi:hypothetical protein N8364_03695 [Saprospiraceae bacterium]|nr:hypothetical protein [Saprospiraceae bacterium]
MKKLIYRILALLSLASWKEQKRAFVFTCCYCANLNSSITQSNNNTEIDSLIKEYSTGVYILVEGRKGITARTWMCNNAQRYIDIH